MKRSHMARITVISAAAVIATVLGLAAAGSDKEAQLKLGKEVYTKHCVLCHMPDGNAPLPEMNMANGKWKHGSKPKQLQKVIRRGVPGTAMAGFKEKLAETEIAAVARYVLTLDKSRATR